MHKEILRLSIPNIIANITVPLLGMIDLAIIGTMDDFQLIAALGIATAVFNLLYWNFGFLRMSTSGFTAQCYGAKDNNGAASVFVKGIALALFISFIILLLQIPLSKLALNILNSSAENYALAMQYYSIRIWAAPATLSLYVTSGWFIGMQDSKTPMFISIAMNVLNIGFSYLFALTMKMGLSGVAIGTLLTQYFGLAAYLFIIKKKHALLFKSLQYKSILKPEQMKKFLTVNRDIFIRSLAVCTVFTFFTSASSLLGDETLAINTIFLQLFIFFSYFMDGFAYAAEALVGRFIGEKNHQFLKETIIKLNIWGVILAVFFTFIYYFGIDVIINFFTKETEISQLAHEYKTLVAIIPFASILAFICDGIMIGATRSREMRNTMILATAFFFAAYYIFINEFQNIALWCALLTFLFMRGVLLVGFVPRVLGR